MKGFIDEFKTFAIKGNVMDLAIAVVIGGAFGKIVSALVDNIITPIVGMLLGGVDFSSLKVIVGSAELTYGSFIQATVDFVIVAFVLFLVIKTINHAKGLTKKEVKKIAEEGPKQPSETDLLIEIRDLLKKEKAE